MASFRNCLFWDPVHLFPHSLVFLGDVIHSPRATSPALPVIVTISCPFFWDTCTWIPLSFSARSPKALFMLSAAWLSLETVDPLETIRNLLWGESSALSLTARAGSRPYNIHSASSLYSCAKPCPSFCSDSSKIGQLSPAAILLNPDFFRLSPDRISFCNTVYKIAQPVSDVAIIKRSKNISLMLRPFPDNTASAMYQAATAAESTTRTIPEVLVLKYSPLFFNNLFITVQRSHEIKASRFVCR